MVSWGWGNHLLWVDSGSLIGDISDESIISVGAVLGVVISNSVGEGVGRLLSKVISNNSMGNWMGNNWGSMDSMVDWSMDSVGNNWGSMDSVGNWVDSVVDWGMDSMVDWGMDSMGKNWGSMSNTVWGNRVEWDNSVLTNWDWSVGSNGGLDLRKSLGVVSLVGDTVGGSKSLALAQGSDLTVSGGNRLA